MPALMYAAALFFPPKNTMQVASSQDPIQMAEAILYHPSEIRNF